MDRINQLQKMLEEDPHDPFLLYALAIEIYKTGNKKLAVEKLNDLIINKPDYLASYYQLATWLKDNLQFDECRKVVNSGIDIAQQQKNYKTLRELKEIINQLDFENE